MPATYTKEVILTGDANPQGDSFTINNLDNVSWVTTSINNAGVNPIISFEIADWPGSQGSTRTANFAVRHWLYDAGDPQAIHEVAFQIIQHAENQVTETTSTTTTSTTTSTTTTTTEAPTSTTSTTTTTTTAAPTPTAAVYTITYNANQGGGVGTTPSTSGPLPLTVANNNFTRTGWTFNNWHTESSGSGSGTGTTYNEGATYNVGSDVTLYAQWSENPTTEAPSIQLTNGNPGQYPVGGGSGNLPFTVTPTSTNVTWALSDGTDINTPGKFAWVTDANGTTFGNIPLWISNVSASTDATGAGFLSYTVATQALTSPGPGKQTIT